MMYKNTISSTVYILEKKCLCSQLYIHYNLYLTRTIGSCDEYVDTLKDGISNIKTNNFSTLVSIHNKVIIKIKINLQI